MKTLLTVLVVFSFAAPAAAQKVRLDDVVRNLRNPDPRARMEALDILREAQHADAIPAIAPLVNDPFDDIQLAAIGTALSFYAVGEVKARKRVAFIIETRRGGSGAEAVFEAGPLAVWPRAVPPELTTNLLKAVDDEHPRVRLEALYAFGAIGAAPAAEETVKALVKALDHYDPAIRAAAARVIGRLQVPGLGKELINAVNDSQPPVRFAAMRALGETRERTAVQALTQQHEHYRKGEGFWAALDALARIGDASSVPLFKTRLAERDDFIRRAAAEGLGRAGDASAVETLEASIQKESSSMVRLAMAFALMKLGRDYSAALLDALDEEKLLPQLADYVAEIGASLAGEFVKRLGDKDAAVRGNAALLLGVVGTGEHVSALQGLSQDRDRDVQRAVERAVERIKLRVALSGR